jgi:uncharacterized membrane protein YcaP (DUF421 family)
MLSDPEVGSGFGVLDSLRLWAVASITSTAAGREPKMAWIDAIPHFLTTETLEQLIGKQGENVSLWQMTIRGILVFLYGLVLVRLAGPRAFSKLTTFDIVLAVLIGSNLSRAFTGNAPLFPTLAATTAIVVVHWALAYLSYNSKLMAWLVKGNVAQLVRNGQIDWKVMRKYGLSEGDLEEAARSKGLYELKQVETAYLERNGGISVIRRG